jgi:hypothetical protein
MARTDLIAYFPADQFPASINFSPLKKGCSGIWSPARLAGRLNFFELNHLGSFPMLSLQYLFSEFAKRWIQW